jgi:hypothetical protein
MQLIIFKVYKYKTKFWYGNFLVICAFYKSFKTMKNNIILALFISLVIQSCSRSVFLDVMRPADITIPGHLTKLGVINRSTVKKNQDTKDKVLNVLEGIVTGESIGADRQASEECINGLFQITSQQNRISYFRINTNIDGTGMTMEKPMLSWEEVDKICADNNLNGILVLEAFDSDNNIRMIQGTTRIKNKDGVMIDVPEFTANANMHLTSSWRIYDRERHKIFDQIMNVNDRGFTGVGPTEQMAASNLPNKRIMLNQTGFAAGTQFGQRISPNWIKVTRSYYKGKGDDMKFGYRLAKKGSWDKAAQVWNRNSNNSNKKNAGKDCFNMALACEIEGKLDLAKEWATKSYEDYGFKPALYYKGILVNRINDEKKLIQQLGE